MWGTKICRSLYNYHWEPSLEFSLVVPRHWRCIWSLTDRKQPAHQHIQRLRSCSARRRSVSSVTLLYLRILPPLPVAILLAQHNAWPKRKRIKCILRWRRTAAAAIPPQRLRRLTPATRGRPLDTLGFLVSGAKRRQLIGAVTLAAGQNKQSSAH
jgi:hypothetical protein